MFGRVPSDSEFQNTRVPQNSSLQHVVADTLSSNHTESVTLVADQIVSNVIDASQIVQNGAPFSSALVEFPTPTILEQDSISVNRFTCTLLRNGSLITLNYSFTGTTTESTESMALVLTLPYIALGPFPGLTSVTISDGFPITWPGFVGIEDPGVFVALFILPFPVDSGSDIEIVLSLSYITDGTPVTFDAPRQAFDYPTLQRAQQQRKEHKAAKNSAKKEDPIKA